MPSASLCRADRPDQLVAKLGRQEMATIAAAAIADTKDTVQSILWGANLVMGQLYDVLYN